MAWEMALSSMPQMLGYDLLAIGNVEVQYHYNKFSEQPDVLRHHQQQEKQIVPPDQPGADWRPYHIGTFSDRPTSKKLAQKIPAFLC